jgi:hypothetical protein
MLFRIYSFIIVRYVITIVRKKKDHFAWRQVRTKELAKTYAWVMASCCLSGGPEFQSSALRLRKRGANRSTAHGGSCCPNMWIWRSLNEVAKGKARSVVSVSLEVQLLGQRITWFPEAYLLDTVVSDSGVRCW